MSERSIWARIVSGAAIFAVAVVSGVISYGHIYDLSLALHQSVLAAQLMPVAIDGLIVVGSVVLLESGSRLGWLGVAPGLTLSVFANVESGLHFGALSAVWAGVPSLSFFLAATILERWLKAQATTRTIPARIGTPVRVAESVPEIESVTVLESVPAPVPVGVPEAQASPVREKRAPVNKAQSPEHVFRAELTEGQLPSLRAVKARMSCGTDKARDILGQLSQVLEVTADA